MDMDRIKKTLAGTPCVAPLFAVHHFESEKHFLCVKIQIMLTDYSIFNKYMFLVQSLHAPFMKFMMLPFFSDFLVDQNQDS